MYLKNIEVQGFKSFANKIKFDFHNGITGIVGPNGSGKSNVADAVRWVLGEQRIKQLRGASMQDVIFAGTESRKPQSYASVSITLDNNDHELPIEYDEVTITRRIYRSGESEYMLNGSACRLKDVNELFYDTGIGKEGYSIIGQGQIDRILSGKPEERRELFDEAAGIVKFKRRKTAAEKRLENEHANLLRVNDILSEIEKQLSPLERQSEVAKLYLKKRTTLESHEVNLFLLEMKRIQAQLVQVEEKANIVKTDLEETGVKYEAIREEYDGMEHELAQLDEGINDKREEMTQTSLSKGKLESQIDVLNEQIRSTTKNDEHFNERIEVLLANKNESITQQSEYEKEQNKILSMLEQVTSQRQQANDKLLNIQREISRFNQGMEQGKTRIMELLNKTATIKVNQQRCSTMLEQTNIRKAQLNQRLFQKQNDEEELLTVLSSQEKQLEETGVHILEKQKKKEEIEKNISEWNQKQVAAMAQLEQVKISFHKDSSKLESLLNIAERYDGYTNSIRKVMEKKNNNPGLIGVVADIIHVEERYEIAIETALGGNIQNMVTDNEQTAKAMIQYLKENKLGRGTFLPLTTITPKEDEKTQAALKEAGVIGRADELIQTEERFRGIMEYLLCRVVVVDTIDHGLTLAKKFHYGLRIVTLEGESLNFGGSLTGGAFKNASNLLGRTREIEDLEKKNKEQKKQIEETQKRLEEIQTAKDFLDQEKILVQEKLTESIMEERTLTLNVERAKKQKQESDSLYQGLAQEYKEIEKQITELKEEIQQTTLEMEEAKHEELKIQEQIKELKESLEEQIYLEEDQGKLVSALQMEEASQAQKKGFALENLERIQKDVLRIEEEIIGLRQNANYSKQDSLKMQEDIREIKETILKAEYNYQQLEEELKLAISKKEQCAAKHKGFFEKREELTKRQGDLDKELFRLEEQRAKLAESMEQQTNHMWEEYEITLHQAQKLRNEEYSNLAEVKKQITLLKDEIKKLGDVNVGAIEEYKSLFGRYSFMSDQREDLIKAETMLMEIIKDLDEGMRKQFQEKFQQIQIEFDKVFRELFGGGKGSLELAENEEVLEAGIIIVAQPPGKKLQNMMQLSGGEKALTAIALLFAIQNMKPSPFCLLDEIEAALDDSNVIRFAKYLGKLKKNTQFIIITHRRGTMTAADRLYGITMQEKGISALVSVNLIEKDLIE